MKAEIKKEETELGKLRDVNEKLKREEELDDIRRTKYEMEVYIPPIKLTLLS